MAGLLHLISILLLLGFCLADGRGLIGYGKTMYQPLCAAACRGAIESAPLTCTPHGESQGGGHMHGATPPECYATDKAFMQTLAFCISKRCGDQYTEDVYERYWRRQEVNGARIMLEPRPSMSYAETIASIDNDPEKEYIAGNMLNETSLISDEDWESNKNALGLFEEVEMGHEKYSLVVLLSGFLIPIGVSTLRFVPFPSRLKSRLNALFNHPAMMGSRHRTPISFSLGIMPTRGQTFFIGYLCLLNILVCAVDYRPGPQPNAWFTSHWEQMMTYLGDRAGVLSFANLSLMFLYSARNNLLLWITDWSHTTYLLLHRWVAYIAIIQASVHSLVWLHWYVKLGTHNEEAKQKYWYWGIIATLSMCILWPLSMLPVRRNVYEFFLISHVALTVLAIVGCYLHVWYLYENNWGYEIWIYTAGAVWGADRVFRIWRFARNGLRRAEVTKIDEDYVRIHVEGVVVAHGHVYLYFPTLMWRFWENHPFSVASSFGGIPRPTPSRAVPTSTAGGDAEKGGCRAVASAKEAGDSEDGSDSGASPTPRPRLTVLARRRGGLTAKLFGRAGSAIPVLVESSYYNPAQQAELNKCTSLVCIAGGVGISAVLPLMHTHPGSCARLYWGMRRKSLKDSIADELRGLDIVYSIGARLDLREIVTAELGRKDEEGTVGFVVSGPEGMADEVRALVCEVSGGGLARRGVVFVDEAFSW